MYVFGGFQGVLLNDVLSFTPGESVVNSININIYNGYEVKLTINEWGWVPYEELWRSRRV